MPGLRGLPGVPAPPPPDVQAQQRAQDDAILAALATGGPLAAHRTASAQPDISRPGRLLDPLPIPARIGPIPLNPPAPSLGGTAGASEAAALVFDPANLVGTG